MSLSTRAPRVCAWVTGLSGSGKTATARRVVGLIEAATQRRAPALPHPP